VSTTAAGRQYQEPARVSLAHSLILLSFQPVFAGVPFAWLVVGRFLRGSEVD
jgi:hypothetical protein